MSGNDRLGRGLGALLGNYAEGIDEAARPSASAPSTVAVRDIEANPFQPRRDFGGAELNELAASIRTNGLLQPVVVRRSASGRTFELVAGERRLRAVRRLGWTDIPAQVREVDDRTLLVLALVENVQREDLGPIEEAKGYGELRSVFGLRQREIAEAVGKSRSSVANLLRLLTLPPSAQRLVDDGKLTMGHGRAIAAIEDPVLAADTARLAAARSWSVRETEDRVRRALERSKKRRDDDRDDGGGSGGGADPAVGALRDVLSAHLEARVAIQWTGKGRGAIRIAFDGPRELERVFAAVTGRRASDVVG